MTQQSKCDITILNVLLFFSMKLIKPFQFIVILLIFSIHCDIILNDYGNGNKGVGVNDQVNGQNNTWIGNANKINGNVNEVVGNENRINGSNNIVQGDGNVVGDISPEQLSKLQNQMFSKIQDRFKGLFNFNSPPPTQQKPVPSQQQPIPSKIQATNISNITNDSIKLNNTVAIETVQNISSVQKEKQNKTKPSESNHAKPHPKSNNNIPLKRLERSTLVFRSYGKRVQQMLRQQIYHLEDELDLEKAANLLCKRWNYCLHTNRDQRWTFSSAYPSFPSEFNEKFNR